MEKIEQIRMYGPIGYWPCDSISFGMRTKQLTAGDKLEILLNSPGGSYFEGIAISSEIKELQSKGVDVSVKVMADCSSAATLVLMSVDKEKRSAYPGAGFLFHRPSSGAYGLAEDLELEADALRKMENEVASIMVAALNEDEGQVKDMLSEAGVFYTTTDMKEKGYIGSIAEPSDEDAESLVVENASTLSKAIMQRKVAVKTMGHNKTGDGEMSEESKEKKDVDSEVKSAYVKGMRAEMARRKELAEICPIGYEDALEEAYNDIEMTAEKFAVMIAKLEKEVRLKAKLKMESTPDEPVTSPITGDGAEEQDDENEKRMASLRWSKSVFLQRSFPGEKGKAKYIEKIMGDK